MSDNIACRGSRFTIEFATLNDGSIPAREFLESQEKRWQARMFVLFRLLADHGEIKNVEKFKKIENTEFYEFKAFKIRMPCYFRPDKRVVVTHGFTKKSDKIRPGDLERARNIKQEYDALLGQT